MKCLDKNPVVAIVHVQQLPAGNAVFGDKAVRRGKQIRRIVIVRLRFRKHQMIVYGYRDCFSFEKHGFSVWNPMVDNWVEQRISELKLEPSAGRSSSQRRKIALIVDRRGWALDNIAAQIVKNLSDSFDFKTLYLSDFNNLGQLLMLADDCQMLHFRRT